MPQENDAFPQTSADAFLNKLNTLRCEEPYTLNPEASPFKPLTLPHPRIWCQLDRFNRTLVNWQQPVRILKKRKITPYHPGWESLSLIKQKWNLPKKEFIWARSVPLYTSLKRKVYRNQHQSQYAKTKNSPVQDVLGVLIAADGTGTN